MKSKPEKHSGAICGGRHHFKTKAEAVKHAHKDYEACIDCWAGIPWTIDNPKPKRKVK
jgi:nitrate/TMAO reductase-like tetraheme cytochrome c subunit